MKSFNPHTHEGCDKAFSLYNVMPQVSIHTPTKGVTRLRKWFLKEYDVSIHTPTKGVTFKSDATDFPIPVSIHTPTKGVTTMTLENI